jgi:ElaB/YqjD/DUF883 family membrane-anchored ribosome-binding protein
MTDISIEQDRIEQDLARTRERMDSRLNDLQERLSPGQVVDDLMAYFRGSEGGDFARNLMASVRANPLPAALTGIGLTWLMASNAQPAVSAGNASGSAKAQSIPPASGYDDLHLRATSAGQEVMRTFDESADDHQGRVHDAQAKVLGLARDAQETAASFGQRIQDSLASAKQAATQKLHDAQAGVSGVTDQVSDSAKQAADQVAQSLQSAQRLAGSFIATLSENPVALGAIGLAVGALLGALVPQSEQEKDALADVAGQARDAATGLAQKAADAGGEVIQKVVDVGMASAKDHGLSGDKSLTELVKGVTSGNLAENVKNVAQDVLQAGDEAARSQHAGADGKDGEESADHPA